MREGSRQSEKADFDAEVLFRVLAEVVQQLHHLRRCLIQVVIEFVIVQKFSCRAFPFYPYITREGDFVGLGTYWTYEDRCWLMSNMRVVEREFVQEFVSAYEYIFTRDPEEYATMKAHSAAHRRVFSRRGQPIPLIGREGGFLQVLPRSGRILPLPASRLPKFGAYVSRGAYAKAIRAAGGDAKMAAALNP